jgi:hypothetical protein
MTKSDDEYIAEFFGVPKLYEGDEVRWDIQGSNKLIFCVKTHELRYRTSWDRLMPVCQKWHNLAPSQFNTDEHKKYMKLCDELDHFVSCYEIEPAYRQLVINVKWYSQKVNPVTV